MSGNWNEFHTIKTSYTPGPEREREKDTHTHTCTVCPCGLPPFFFVEISNHIETNPAVHIHSFEVSVHYTD
jgi:hypothetical protein